MKLTLSARWRRSRDRPPHVSDRAAPVAVVRSIGFPAVDVGDFSGRNFGTLCRLGLGSLGFGSALLGSHSALAHSLLQVLHLCESYANFLYGPDLVGEM